MWRHLGPALAFILLGGLFAVVLVRIGNGRLDVREIQSPLIGKAAPSFRLASVTDGSQWVDSRELAGKMYVLNVWGTWCAACRDEHPVLLEIARSAHVPIIGLDWKDEPETAREFLATLGNPYAAVAADRDGRVAIDWGVYGAPETFLVSASGQVLIKQVGPMTPQIWSDRFVPLLNGGAR